jgi:hypothetical protein
VIDSPYKHWKWSVRAVMAILVGPRGNWTAHPTRVDFWRTISVVASGRIFYLESMDMKRLAVVVS